jgi:Restriction endonuclease
MKNTPAKNTGKPYESLTQQVFDEIVNQDAVKTVQIQRDVVLQGLCTEHQIDVYWEFELGGISYFNVVEAKDWGRPVDQGEVIQFKGVLDDLPGQPKGIFVTRTGFQSGAIDFAQKRGIILYELREPTDADWEGRIKGFLLNFHAAIPRFENIRLIPDNDWATSEFRRLSISEGQVTDAQGIFAVNAKLYTEDDTEITFDERFLASLFPTGFEEIPPTEMVHTFEKPTFTHTNISWFPRLKLVALEAKVSLGVVVQEVLIKGSDFICYILKDVLTGEVRAFDEGPKLIR